MIDTYTHLFEPSFVGQDDRVSGMQPLVQLQLLHRRVLHLLERGEARRVHERPSAGRKRPEAQSLYQLIVDLGLKDAIISRVVLYCASDIADYDRRRPELPSAPNITRPSYYESWDIEYDNSSIE